MTLNEFKTNAAIKLGFKPCIPRPYKLCDFKPAYGFLFEEYIQNYEYWGHCDCDLIFGNLGKILTPILEKGYDKVFAAGHLTIYRNTHENNRRFMKPLNGHEIYREAFTTSKIYVFDENVACWMNPNRKNVHSIFKQDNCEIFEEDLSYNVSTQKSVITRTKYNPRTQGFSVISLPYSRVGYYFTNSGVHEIAWDNSKSSITKRDYLYMHLQSRHMRINDKDFSASVISIRPDRFIGLNQIPQSKKQIPLIIFQKLNMFWIDTYKMKIIKKIRSFNKREQ
nr:DUF6625 family protein [Bifidobacterium sp. DSM 109957]